QTRLDQSEIGVQERPSGLAVADDGDQALLAVARANGEVDAPSFGPAIPTGAVDMVDAVANARLPGASIQGATPPDGQVARVIRTGPTPPAALLPVGLALMSIGLLLVAGGNAVGWRRRERPAWALALIDRPDWTRSLPRASLAARRVAADAGERVARISRQ